MHVRVRIFGKPDTVVVVESKLTKIEQFRRIIKDKFAVDVKLQRLFYGGKLLEDGYTFHDYNIKLNDVIQLMAKVQLNDNPTETKKESDSCEAENETEENKVVYEDAKSCLYNIGDLIDMRDREQGAWFEGKIVRIVKDPTFISSDTENNEATATENNETCGESSEKENESKTMSLNTAPESPSKKQKKGIAKYFSKTPKKKQESTPKPDEKSTDFGLLYKVELEAEEDSEYYCKLYEIRPRARIEIKCEDLKPGDKIMVNHNVDEPSEKGYWYDFTVNEIRKFRTSFELVGTLYLGPEAVPQNDTKVKIHDKIFAIEKVVPLDQRTEEYEKLMITDTERRSQPLNCLTCRDDEDLSCKDCGCYLCSGKENPEKIVLCDECNKGFHMKCLDPPLTELPEEDWYCPSCKRDTTEVIAPGAAKQVKKSTVSKTSRDWGRGMACVGKTKTCAMPPNHFGPIPGIEVGMCWRFRIQLSESGVHRPPVSGIHGRDVEGAYSIVLSGGYEDDYDNGYEFTYTGSGGRDLSGNKRTAEQSCDQTLTRENKALARNCAVKAVSESGGDAGDNWRDGKPVRVVRSYKMQKHFPKYAPKEGIRYDGIYKVVKYYPEKGLSGYRVWKYLLRRDDPSPAPWEDNAKQYPIIYPDGYLEAEAEKKALKQKNGKATGGSKKRALKESNHMSESDEEISQPRKKRKTSTKGEIAKNKETDSNEGDSPKVKKIPSMFSPKSKSAKVEKNKDSALSDTELAAIKADTLNSKLWDECLVVCEARGKKEFVEHVTQIFLCIICQEVAVSPVTTPCLHNFCMACLKLAFKSTGSQACPCCRQSLAKFEVAPNEHLKVALQSIMPGYDAGKNNLNLLTDAPTREGKHCEETSQSETSKGSKTHCVSSVDYDPLTFLRG